MNESEMLMWLASIERAPATVLSCRAEGIDCVRIEVSTAAHPVAGTFARPGQYVALGLPGGEARFFAIASAPPVTDRVEFVVQRGSAISDALATLAPGATVSMSAAMGEGYPVDVLRGGELVAFTTGTGLAAVRPVVDALLADGASPASLHVYHASTNADALVFADELARWTSAGVDVHTVFDTVPVRYVQDVWREDPAAPSPTAARYVVCGSAPMQRAVAESLRDAGVPDERVHYNW